VQTYDMIYLILRAAHNIFLPYPWCFSSCTLAKCKCKFPTSPLLVCVDVCDASVVQDRERERKRKREREFCIDSQAQPFFGLWCKIGEELKFAQVARGLHVYIYIHNCMCIYMHIDMYVCVYVHTYIYIYIYIYIYMYISYM